MASKKGQRTPKTPVKKAAKKVSIGDLAAPKGGTKGGGEGTQDAMKRVLFGAAGVTGGLATPGVINW